MRRYTPRIYVRSLRCRKPQWQKVVEYVSVDEDMDTEEEANGFASNQSYTTEENTATVTCYVRPLHHLSIQETGLQCGLGSQ